MKYIDAEKLKAEIERQKKYLSESKLDERSALIAYDIVLSFISSLQQVPEPTCKTCGFYENDCPFTRGKFMPYPNKVCKYYTSSAIKEQEQQEKSTTKNCNNCPHCIDRKDQIGWHFRGCFGGQYKGKPIAEIEECPLQQEQPGLPDVEESGVPGKDYIPVEWVDACEKYGKWKIVKQERPEVDLEKFTEEIKTYQGRYKHPESVSIKGAMAFMARMFYQYPNVARLWYDNLPKATMD